MKKQMLDKGEELTDTFPRQDGPLYSEDFQRAVHISQLYLQSLAQLSAEDMAKRRKCHKRGDIPAYEQRCLDAIKKIRATRKEYNANTRDKSHPIPFCYRCAVHMCCRSPSLNPFLDHFDQYDTNDYYMLQID